VNNTLNNIIMISLMTQFSILGTKSGYLTLLYEGKVKSFRPNLRETRDKRPLGRKPDKN
jgi:hypothetical protein